MPRVSRLAELDTPFIRTSISMIHCILHDARMVIVWDDYCTAFIDPFWTLSWVADTAQEAARGPS